MKHHRTLFRITLMICTALSGCASETLQPDTTSPTAITAQIETAAFIPETEPPATTPSVQTETISETIRTAIFTSAEDVGLYAVDGEEETYAFDYDGETFQAVYSPDNWKILNSYRITEAGDMVCICEALAEIHPIYGADMQSFRTAEDMAYEWAQHNLAYQLLPEDSPWRQSVRDVDIDPKDQGKSVYDFLQERLGDGSQ